MNLAEAFINGPCVAADVAGKYELVSNLPGAGLLATVAVLVLLFTWLWNINAAIICLCCTGILNVWLNELTYSMC